VQYNLKQSTIYVTGLSHSKMDQRHYNKPKAEVRNVACYNRKQGDRD